MAQNRGRFGTIVVVEGIAFYIECVSALQRPQLFLIAILAATRLMTMPDEVKNQDLPPDEERFSADGGTSDHANRGEHKDNAVECDFAHQKVLTSSIALFTIERILHQTCVEWFGQRVAAVRVRIHMEKDRDV